MIDAFRQERGQPMFPLARWQTALSGPHDEARRMRLGGLVREAYLIDQTMLRAFAPLLADLNEESGWQRALRALANLDAPLLLDTVAGDDVGLPSVRVTAILALPDIAAIEDASQIINAIRSGISVGAPTYNDGDARSCGIIYWAAAFTLILAPVTRGFTGQARIIKTLRTAIEETISTGGIAPQALDDFAWRMRRALDATLDLLR
jgi:hypothetical protein